ncbi:histidinol-phosphate transaminase [Paraburkholderia sp.]|uniref:histidinol-phosphate transaminase n=1 Tax=Paraburkholderia sp. TaxID=1926495 RepID=UPI002384A847|nr:histidinol-phosphate transaminase [Paraburkholderia sp.]MDE1181810.1 histidinol-phosphate transaminase [Paraburkholderia sp.]
MNGIIEPAVKSIAARTPVLPHINALPHYIPGKSERTVARDYGLTRIVTLASNENPLGCSPRVAEALTAHLTRGDAASTALARYPDSDAFELREALATYHQVPSDHIAVTNGSHELIDLCAALCLRDGAEGVHAQYAFQAYPISIKARGATAIEVPAREFGHDAGAMCDALTARTRLVYICNPNNPTGTLLSQAEIEQIIDATGPDTLVVLDEAYIDYLDPSLRVDATALVARHPNLIVARTFSKAYGLASLRIGYGIMQPHLADAIARIRPTFSVNALAQRAAVAALADRMFLMQTQDANRRGIEQITRALSHAKIAYVPTHANFIAIHVRDAAVVAQRMVQAGVVVRPLAAYALDNMLRVTVGTEEENAAFLDALFTALDIR